MDCYIVNLSHTQRRDLYITIWRPDDRGYCWALSRAGKYPRDHVMTRLGYYNSGCSNVAVPCGVLDAVAVAPIPGHHDNDAGPCVENTRANWKLILASVIAQPAYPSLPEFKGARRVRAAA
ncbi:MAG: hypothetical protein KDH15_01120 [Rhodocyclaceae bacterium]|nr:hypothetical protein [Rhodocyclaceae bacterium]